MGKLTYVIAKEKWPYTRARVVIDGTTVHASHPDDAERLVQFPNASEQEALATFKKVIEKYFHPRDGWKLAEKRPGVADLSSWKPPAPSPEEAAAAEKEAALAQQRRQQGWVVDADLMVIAMDRQRDADLEPIVAAGAFVQMLHVITTHDDDDVDERGAAAAGSDDESGRGHGGTRALLALIERGAFPKLTQLTFDNPWESLTRVSSWPLRGLAGVVANRGAQLERLTAVGSELRWPAKCALPRLRSLSLLDNGLGADVVENIGKATAPQLRALSLGFTYEAEADGDAESALVQLPLLAQLEELTLTGVSNVPVMLAQLTERGGGKALPRTLRIDGNSRDDDAMLAAVQAWRKRAPPASTLQLGGDALECGDDALQALQEIVGAAFTSPFDVSAHGARVQALWKQLA